MEDTELAADDWLPSTHACMLRTGNKLKLCFVYFHMAYEKTDPTGSTQKTMPIMQNRYRAKIQKRIKHYETLQHSANTLKQSNTTTEYTCEGRITTHR